MQAKNIEAAKAILSQQTKGSEKWGVLEHLYCITKVLLPIIEAETGELDADSRKALGTALRAALKEDGLGGNASQFRQALVKEALLPKTEGAVIAGYDE